MAIAAGLCAHGSHGYEHNQVLVPWVRHVRTTKGGGGAIGLGQQWHRGAERSADMTVRRWHRQRLRRGMVRVDRVVARRGLL